MQKPLQSLQKTKRRWKSKSLSEDNISEFKKNCVKYNYSTKFILPHDGYLINLGQPYKAKLENPGFHFLMN